MHIWRIDIKLGCIYIDFIISWPDDIKIFVLSIIFRKHMKALCGIPILSSGKRYKEFASEIEKVFLQLITNRAFRYQ